MRELHVVGTDADGALLLAERPGGPARYRLPDARVVPQPREREIRRQPSPAQIQARLRRGMSPEAIARETGADVDRVLRWAAPVQAEMADVLRQALDSHVLDGERHAEATLEQLVRAALGTAPPDWQATRRADGRWRVLLTVTEDGASRTASWIWDGRRRRLVAASARARSISFPADDDG